jgi:Flp pilus assembly pilin Flp
MKGGDRAVNFDKFRFLKDEAAIESSEVAVIIAVVVLVAFGAYQLLGQKIVDVIMNVVGKL